MTFSLSLSLSLPLSRPHFFPRVPSPHALTYTALAISLFFPLSLTPNYEQWTLDTRDRKYGRPEGGIAARGSADDYEVVNLLGSSAPSAVLCTASRWRLKKTAPAGTRLVPHRHAPCPCLLIERLVQMPCLRDTRGLSFCSCSFACQKFHYSSLNSSTALVYSRLT